MTYAEAQRIEAEKALEKVLIYGTSDECQEAMEAFGNVYGHELAKSIAEDVANEYRLDYDKIDINMGREVAGC